MANARILNKLIIGGETYTRDTDIPADGSNYRDKVMEAAKTGQLTTRTDNNTGTLTMSASHGITTGARLDVYWEENGVKGSRYGMTVGTVSVNSVPIDLGGGDNLPTNLTNVTAQVPLSEELTFTGNNAQFAAAKCNKLGLIVFTQSDDTLIKAVQDELEDDRGGGWQWYTGSGITNPFASVTNGKVYFSNGDSSTTNTMRAEVGTS